jgi:hypothetical protein
MSRKISVSTAKTLHEPIEVDINGQVFYVKVNRSIFERLIELEKEFRKAEKGGSAYAAVFLLYEEVELMTGAPRELVAQLDFNDLKEIISFVLQSYYTPPKLPAGAPETAETKNGSKPGEGQSLT